MFFQLKRNLADDQLTATSQWQPQQLCLFRSPTVGKSTISEVFTAFHDLQHMADADQCISTNNVV